MITTEVKIKNKIWHDHPTEFLPLGVTNGTRYRNIWGRMVEEKINEADI